MRSLWQAGCGFEDTEPLRGSVNADVAVIGAGLAGVLTAHFLQNRGLKTVVLERNRLGEGETGRTTAKITAQHGIIYDNLISQYGLGLARRYAEANLKAISQYERMVQSTLTAVSNVARTIFTRRGNRQAGGECRPPSAFRHT